MGRPAIPFEKSKLQLAIDTCESTGHYTQRQALWQDVASAYAKAVGIESVSPVWVYLRVEENNLNVKTPKGKKGRQPGQVLSQLQGGKRVTRGEKFAKNETAMQFFDRLEKIIKKEQKGRFLPVLERAKNGSVKALVKLKCLDCANWQTTEVKNCQCLDCPLLIIRPYQKSISEENEVEVAD